MAVTLTDAISDVRHYTRHDLDTRVTDARITGYLNDAAVEIRSRLCMEVPSLYLYSSPAIVIGDESAFNLETISGLDPANIYRVEYNFDSGDTWMPLTRADEEQPNVSVHNQLTWRLEGNYLIIGPQEVDISGSYRIVYHPLPTELSHPADAAEEFEIPRALKQCLIFIACGLVAARDGSMDEKEKWDKLSDAEWKKVIPALRSRHGVHRNQAGLRRILGY